MTTLLVLLTFLVIATIIYLVRRDVVLAHRAKSQDIQLKVPVMTQEAGLDVPKGFRFHLGHTWAYDEGRQIVRVGIDSFATKVVGQIDHIEVEKLNRWVRQGKRVCTITHGDTTVDFLSPVEGVVVSVNYEVLHDPSVIQRDPYKDGWICVIKAPDLDINLKNLIQESMLGIWIQTSLRRLQSYAAPLGAATADGGLPIDGMLSHVGPDAKREMLREFFLN